MKTVVISILGTTLDRRGRGEARWDKWRPSVSLCQQSDLPVARLDLLVNPSAQGLAKQVKEDIGEVSPDTRVNLHELDFQDPWDFESVYATLLDFARAYPFKPGKERYLIHITTGTHVAQICLYLLTEAGYLPGQLLQTSPGKRDSSGPGDYQIIDLDLSKYDQIAARFQREAAEDTSYLKSGIETQNVAFNQMIAQLEKVSIRSNEPILLTGPTGAGKSQLANRIYALKKNKGKVLGKLVTVNCATLKGDNAMSALFGHKKGAFTGANTERPGLLREAHEGLLFLDEIGELGLDEQAMLLRAIEDKTFLPLGADRELSSDFVLIAGTNRDLREQARQGAFREDLLARIDLWTYRLPSLKERIEDFEANLDFELDKYTQKYGNIVRFGQKARQYYLKFAHAPASLWSANFRDLNASITRMATLAEGGRIDQDVVDEEINRLQGQWQGGGDTKDDELALAKNHIGEAQFDALDYYDQRQLATVLAVCRRAQSMAEAGRILFDKSRLEKKSSNDSHRVKQILDRFGVSFTDL